MALFTTCITRTKQRHSLYILHYNSKEHLEEIMLSQMNGVGKSHAKAILIGEHAVVYGEPAIAIPLPNMTVTATLRPAFRGQTIDGAEFHGDLSELGANVEGARQLLLRLLDKFDMSTTPFHLAIDLVLRLLWQQRLQKLFLIILIQI